MVGYSDSSFSPYGGRSYGASVITVNGGPVAWKAGKQAMITLSTMESELLEATTAAVLLESIGCLLDEILSRRVPRVLKVDNSAATLMLQGGAGTWRTRHLKLRCNYIREQVACGALHVFHTEGRYQLADLSTKMHPRARLLDLLQQWSFDDLPEEAICVQIARAVVAYCVLTVLQEVPRANAGEASNAETKEPLAVSGTEELILVASVVAVLAVFFWELGKMLVKWVRRYLKRETRLKRLRELARLTAEEEIERLQLKEVTAREVQGAVQSALTTSLTSQANRLPEPEQPTTPRARSSHQPAAEPQPRSSPGAQSTVSSLDDDTENRSDRPRLCKDVLSLMTCEALKNGLRAEGLTVSGLKTDQVARLSLRLVPMEGFGVMGRELPTDRQLRYILWLWRHRHLNGRCSLSWSNVYTKQAASSWIHVWKDA